MNLTREQVQGLGYTFIREISGRGWCGLSTFIFTTGLVCGITRDGYMTRFCYEKEDKALAALLCWEGKGDPPGPWIKEKGRVERLGPGALSEQ